MTLIGKVQTFSSGDNNSGTGYYLLNADDGAGTSLSTLYLFTYLSFIKHVCDRHCYYLHYRGEETDAYLLSA